MEYILKNGIVFDPKNNVKGEQMDILIKDNKITLGFINDNLIAQAKSATKLPNLQNAISQVAPTYEVNLI